MQRSTVAQALDRGKPITVWSNRSIEVKVMVIA